MMIDDIVRVLRIVQYEGPRKAVEETIACSIHGTRSFQGKNSGLRISAATLDQFPMVLEDAAQTPDVKQIRQMQEQLDKQLKDLARYSNPWTVEVQRFGTEYWQSVCHDAPLSLCDAELRMEELHQESPEATFRLIPWLNSQQRSPVGSSVVKGPDLSVEDSHGE